jgi:GT2 family glycosyltransferase
VELDRYGAGRDVGHGEPDGPQFDGTRDLELFTGGAILLRADFLREVGLFDERFFLYYEDVDLGLRGRRRGWRYRYVGASTVRHHGGVSTSKDGRRTAYLRERNRLWILLRHRSLRDLARGAWLSARRLRHPPRSVHARAMLAGLAAAPRLVLARLRDRA